MRNDRPLLPAFALLLLAALAVPAADFPVAVDDAFAEKWAFAADRAALLDELPPRSEARFFFETLLAQQQGRIADARASLDAWRQALHPRDDSSSPAFDEMRRRQYLLEFPEKGDAEPGASRLFAGGQYDYSAPRDPAAPLPSALDAVQTWNLRAEKLDRDWPKRLVPRFHALGLHSGAATGNRADLLSHAENSDAPGMLDIVLADLKDTKIGRPFGGYPIHGRLTLAQLDTLRDALRGTPRALDDNDAFVEAYLAKLGPGADDDPADPAVRLVHLRRILAFAETLPASRADLLALARFHVLDFGLRHGDLRDKPLLLDYLRGPRLKVLKERINDGGFAQIGVRLAAPRAAHNLADEAVLPEVADDSVLVNGWLAALFAAEQAEPAEFDGLLNAQLVARLHAEARLTAGLPMDEAAVRDAIGDGYFRALRDRAELAWTPGNPDLFAPRAPVALRLDIKNVPTLHIAVYDLDAGAICRQLGRAPRADLDLDGCVPTAERDLDFSAVPAIRRHTETLALPELADAGLYIVECSGAGLSCRAFVRKGRLRAVERIGAAGPVVTVLDEEGNALADADLWLGNQVFPADENGEILLPFAQPGAPNRRTAVLQRRDGRLATVFELDHPQESYKLVLGAMLPVESLVAGEEATLVARASVVVSGAARVSPEILEKPTLELHFYDIDGLDSVRTIPLDRLAADTDIVQTFRVPARLSCVRPILSGTVRNRTTGEDEKLTAEDYFEAYAETREPLIAEPLLLRDGDGYRIEVRGRNGEPIADEVLYISPDTELWNDSSTGMYSAKTDADGIVRLGPLPNVRALNVKDLLLPVPAAEYSPLPDALHVAENEAFELDAPGFRGKGLPARNVPGVWVSLLSLTAQGETVADHIGAVTLDPARDTVRVAGLPAGDYDLRLRALKKTIRVRVTRAAPGDLPDVLPGPARGLSADAAAHPPLRIAEASFQTRLTGLTPARPDSDLRIRVENASPETRVHLVARRYARAAANRSFAAPVPSGASKTWSWARPRTDLLDGRRLSDEARYILDRRAQPHRIGNLLFRPSLLLSPWSVAETENRRTTGAAGDALEPPPPPLELAAGASSRGSYGGNALIQAPFAPFLDFLPSPALVLANLRPDANGVVTVPAAALAGRHDIELFAVDGEENAVRRVALAAQPYEPRDLRHIPAADPAAAHALRKSAEALPAGAEVPATGASATRWQAYATVADLLRLFQAVQEDDTLAEFSFIGEWHKLDDDRRRDLYSRHACHELDLFLYHRDRAFFDAVVAPNLRHKPAPDFLDRWLLGDDLADIAADPARIEALTPLEITLLARRRPELRERIARSLREAVEAHPADPKEEDLLFRTALHGNGNAETLLFMGDNDGDPFGDATLAEAEVAFDAAPMPAAAPPAAAINHVATVRSPIVMKGMLGSRSAEKIAADRRDLARRNEPPRALWRPPQPTREWVDTYYWKHRRADKLKWLAHNRFWIDTVDPEGFAVRSSQLPVDPAASESPAAAAPPAATGNGELETANSGEAAPFLSPHILDAAKGSFTERMAALALTDLPFEGAGIAPTKDASGATVFRAATPAYLFREVAQPAAPADDDTARVLVVQKFIDATAQTERPRGEPDAYVTGPFVAGRPYLLRTVVVNPDDRPVRVSVFQQIPQGAIPLAMSIASGEQTLDLDPYKVQENVSFFYFPAPSDEPFVLPPATATDRGALAGRADPASCAVVATVPPDESTWSWIAAHGTDEQVLEALRTRAPEALDLPRIGWRLVRDAAFSKAVLDILDDRLLYDPALYFTAFRHRDAPHAAAWLRHAGSIDALGRWFRAPLAEVDPEEQALFELREYWPLIAPRVHPFGREPVPVNASLAAQWRSLLDTLAYKPAPDDRDRLAAACLLIAQERPDEAAALLGAGAAGAGGSGGSAPRPLPAALSLQRDYLLAYLAMSAADIAKARALAEPHRDHPVPLWRDRFRDLLAVMEESEVQSPKSEVIPPAAQEGGAGALPRPLQAPSLSLALVSGAPRLTAQGLPHCFVSAYPVDIEALFSRDPFLGADMTAKAVFLRPAWTSGALALPADGAPVPVELPEALRGRNLVLEARAPDGSLPSRVALLPASLDAQAAPAQGMLTVRGADGKPLPGAYVKVYARGKGAGEPAFHKDGYTDLRGRFDYATVSAEQPFAPAEFAILVLHDDTGRSATLRAPAPQ